MKTPQTVSFELRLRYMYWDRVEAGLPEWRYFKFENLEEMISFAMKERKRRARKDRATTAEYEVVLTEHGKEVCESDPVRAASHEPLLGKHHLIY